MEERKKEVPKPSKLERIKNISSAIFEYFKHMCTEGFKNNDNSCTKVYEGCNKALDHIGTIVSTNELSNEEIKWYIDKDIEILDKMIEKDSENKEFVKKLIFGFFVGAATVGLICRKRAIT